ncbi:hypothetical protein [Richelia sinica]|nr:hypothetical protein [Richelia sinica]
MPTARCANRSMAAPRCANKSLKIQELNSNGINYSVTPATL